MHAAPETPRTVGGNALHVIRILNLTDARFMTRAEVEAAANVWSDDVSFHGFEKLPYIATGTHDCGAALLQHNSLLSWIQVRELINVDEGDDLTDQRARAILLLCAVYGLRAREVVRLGPDTVSYTTEVINTRGRIATDLLNARSRLT